MITYIKIDGFKSFKDFEMHFTPFTVIAGTNASGKSNLFDALQLLSDLARFPLNKAFTQQRGNGTELFTQYDEDLYATEMSFAVELLVPPTVSDEWGGEARLQSTRLRYEITIGRGVDDKQPFELTILHEELKEVLATSDIWTDKLITANQRAERIMYSPYAEGIDEVYHYIYTVKKEGLNFIHTSFDSKQDEERIIDAGKSTRTALSANDKVDYPHAYATREEISKWRFLQLNTEHLRQPTPKTAGISYKITSSGENLAAALYRIQKPEPFIMNDISRDMANLIRPLVEVTVKDDSANNQYLIEVKSSDSKKYSSRVLSEGTLRLLTLSIFRHDYEHTGLLCYEEPENGVHPGRIPKLVNLLNDLAVDFSDPTAPLRQIIVNTHSPIVVGEVIKLEESHGASVWFTQLASTLVEIAEKRYPVRITLASLVAKEKSSNKVLDWAGFYNKGNDKIRRLTLIQAKEYLAANGISENSLSL
jgi:predicted ATPase